MKQAVLAIALGFATAAGAQKTNTKAATVPNRPEVDKLCGCFEVEFKYAETFAPDKNYKYHDREEISGGTELVLPVEVSDKRIVMQHLLVITDSMIIKHWREEWTYENPVIWNYKGDKVWEKETLKPEQVKGKWTQTVWEVSDEPRYQGVASWVSADNQQVWINTTDAPLPRREYSTRSDYNILKRTNTISINDSGYIHSQDNKKIIRQDGVDRLLVEEKGINSYKRVPEEDCAAGKAYWEKTKDYWTKVRTTWESYIATQSKIMLKTKVEGKVLHEYLFALAKDYVSKKVTDAELEGRIKQEIQKFIATEKEVAILK